MKIFGAENKILKEEEEKNILEKTNKILFWFKDFSKKLNETELLVDDSLRIVPDNFYNIYSKQMIDYDKNYVSTFKQKFDSVQQKDYKIGNFSKGEFLEIGKTFLFNKYLKDRFITIRSSLYDDYLNNIDNIIVDKKSGRVVCAIDEISAMQGDVFNQKMERILKINKNGGAKIKYGFIIKDGKIVKSQLYNVPYLYLPLKIEYVFRLIENIDLVSESKEEINILIFFLQLINQQISALRLENKIKEWKFLGEIEDFILKYVSDIKKSRQIKN